LLSAVSTAASSSVSRLFIASNRFFAHMQT